MKYIKFFIPAILILFSLSCYGDVLGPDEYLVPPSGLITLEDHSYKLWLPLEFEDPENYGEEYPLVIALHGRTSLTDHYFQPCIVNDEEQYAAYPCVYFAPNNSNLGFGSYGGDNESAQWIRDEINLIVENDSYRIDRSRIYIIGFSMGGHGSTFMAQDLFDQYGYLVAGIVPVGGGVFEYITSPEVLNNISVWSHYGSEDYNQESDYLAAEAYYPFADRDVVHDSITYTSWDGNDYTYQRVTKILCREDVEIFKSSEYMEMGHTTGPVFKDPELLQWLFRQRVLYR